MPTDSYPKHSSEWSQVTNGTTSHKTQRVQPIAHKKYRTNRHTNQEVEPLSHPPTSVSMKKNTLRSVKKPRVGPGDNRDLVKRVGIYFESTKILPFRPRLTIFSGPRKRDRPDTQASNLGAGATWWRDMKLMRLPWADSAIELAKRATPGDVKCDWHKIYNSTFLFSRKQARPERHLVTKYVINTEPHKRLPYSRLSIGTKNINLLWRAKVLLNTHLRDLARD